MSDSEMPATTPAQTPQTGPTLADLMEGFRQAGDAAVVAIREHFAPMLPLMAELVAAREAIERDERRARQLENGRDFRRAVARYPSRAASL
jgi:hypothetical protein